MQYFLDINLYTNFVFIFGSVSVHLKISYTIIYLNEFKSWIIGYSNNGVNTYKYSTTLTMKPILAESNTFSIYKILDWIPDILQTWIKFKYLIS